VNTYHIQYYGLLADRRGMTEETVQHPALTPAALHDELLGDKTARYSIRAVVNDEFVAWDRPLKDQDRVAFLPPMSGG
jgi:molybdopterin synthase sulfur carrier subunit